MSSTATQTAALQERCQNVAEPTLKLLADTSGFPIAFTHPCGRFQLFIKKTHQFTCLLFVKYDGIDLVVASQRP